MILTKFSLEKLHKKRPSMCRFAAAFLLLGLCLVGSCKTEDLPSAYGSVENSAQFRIALFPDQVVKAHQVRDGNYTPANGYVSTARHFVAKRPDSLLMLTADEVEILLGQPHRVRSEKPAKVWQYQAENCVLDVYFYTDRVQGKDQGQRIAYYEIRRIDYDQNSYDVSYTLPRSKKAQCLTKIIDHGGQASGDVAA